MLIKSSQFINLKFISNNTQFLSNNSYTSNNKCLHKDFNNNINNNKILIFNQDIFKIPFKEIINKITNKISLSLIKSLKINKINSNSIKNKPRNPF